MATPILSWMTSSNSNGGTQGRSLYTLGTYGSSTAEAGDLVLAFLLVMNPEGTTAPTITPASGWGIISNNTATYIGAYGIRMVVISKVITQQETQGTPVIWSHDGPAGCSQQTDAWGVRGAAASSLALSYQKNTPTSSGEFYNVNYPPLATAQGDLLIRAAICSSYGPTNWPELPPSGYAVGPIPNDNSSSHWLHYQTANTSAAPQLQVSAIDNGISGLTTYTIRLSDTPGGPVLTLGDLSLSNSTVHANAPVGHVIGNIIGQTSGSTLSLRPTEPRVSLVGTELRVADALTQGNPLFPEIDETLADAVGSPKFFGTMVDVGPSRICEFIHAAVGTTTPVIPAHQAGDLLVCFMFRDGSATAPAIPAGWTNVRTGSTTSASYRLVSKRATSSSESGGTPSTATSCITSVYRPNTDEGYPYLLTVGSSAQSVGTTNTSFNYPALSVSERLGYEKPWIGAAAGHRSVNTSLETPPSGMVIRSNALDATDEAVMFDTNGSSSSRSSSPVTIGGTNSGWCSVIYEITGAGTKPLAPTRKAPRYSSWL